MAKKEKVTGYNNAGGDLGIIHAITLSNGKITSYAWGEVKFTPIGCLQQTDFMSQRIQKQ
ncbi:hypothetical protein [Bacillus sp. UNC438CL73TsuS30]|uniref:hypothetical protein n=1 Tax=Bacillus sp. UNC438CL73TsuS30 TaxID=1340434 RepID=UPI00047E259D|nr:hypothetical protein [Bacillus sp. UNC438CL73TsuS30]